MRGIGRGTSGGAHEGAGEVEDALGDRADVPQSLEGRRRGRSEQRSQRGTTTFVSPSVLALVLHPTTGG